MHRGPANRKSSSSARAAAASASSRAQARPSILVCDDEPAIADVVADLMRREGFACTACHDSASALDAMRNSPFDLAILDIMMPGMDGFELARRIRAFSDVPIVFLSAKDEEVDHVLGFAVGADDYVTKLDPRAHEASLHGEPLTLTPKEFALLKELMEACGAPRSAADLFERVWEASADAAAANTVMVHVRHLRRKLAAIDSSAEFVVTVWGVGYRMNL